MSRWITIAALMLMLTTRAAAQDDAIAARLAAMTLEQKVGQLFMVTLHGGVMTEAGARFLQDYQPGAVVLFTSNIGTPDAMTRLTNQYQTTITEAGGAPLLIAVDQEGGVVSRLTREAGYTFFPTPLLVTAAGERLAFQFGQAIAQELAAIGVNMNLAPVADLETNRDNPIIARRAYSNDPAVAAPILAEVVRGTQAYNGGLFNVLATAKHFPGHGASRGDSHAQLERLELTRERLDTIELAPFRAAIEAGVGAIMVDHIWYPALEPERVPASLSRGVITDLLRNELGYDGLIMTDALDMNAVDLEFEFTEAAVMAIHAGNDLLAMGPGIDASVAATAIDRVLEAVRAGEITEARIDESAYRVLAAKQRFGILNWTPLDPAGAIERLNAEDHAALLNDLFEGGVTIAYDRADLLPVRADASVAVIFLGTRYQIYDECGLYRDDIRWVVVSESPADDEIGRATEAARASDVAIVWTQNAITNERQQMLVNALPQEKTAAVAMWSPYDRLTYPGVAAYVATYSPARESVPAACAVLFGALPARGQLAIALGDDLPAGSRDASE